MNERQSTDTYTRTYDYADVKKKMLLSNNFGIFIDDTGSPGLQTTPSKLHPSRKSWVAVIVPPQEMPTLDHDVCGIVDALRSDLGLHEYHFSEIWSGKGPYRSTTIEERLVIIQMFVNIFHIHKIRILVQTLDPGTHETCTEHWPELPRIAGCFDFSSHDHTALWLLLTRIRDHVIASRTSSASRALVLLDEGIRKPGYLVEVDVFDDVFLDGALHFASSSMVPYLQLADFAAFCLNRSQLIIHREKRSAADIQLLEILEPIAPQFVNCRLEMAWPTTKGPMV